MMHHKILRSFCCINTSINKGSLASSISSSRSAGNMKRHIGKYFCRRRSIFSFLSSSSYSSSTINSYLLKGINIRVEKDSQTETLTKAFVDILLRHPITEIDFSEGSIHNTSNVATARNNIDGFGNIDCSIENDKNVDKDNEKVDNSSDNAAMLEQIKKIKSTIKDDRVYKFVKRMKSLDDFETPTLDSIVWKDVSNAVEVYMLPPSISWPSNISYYSCCFFPNFVIRRMNNLHRHRVLSTINRLWYEPSEKDSMLVQKVVWAGSTGTGISIANNEIILESILKLNEIGLENMKRYRPTHNQFYYKNDHLTRFYFDESAKQVNCEVLSFDSDHQTIVYLNNEAFVNNKSFVIYETDQLKKDINLTMPHLINTYCEKLEENLKPSLKAGLATYLYDPLERFEFEFFLNVCYSFGESNYVAKKDFYMSRFTLLGGIFRNNVREISDKCYRSTIRHSYHPDLLASFDECTPLDIDYHFDSIIGVKFRIPIKFEGDKVYDQFYSNRLSNNHIFPSDNAKLEYCHSVENWRVDFLSDELAVKFGNAMNISNASQQSDSYHLSLIQKAVTLYGGILNAKTKDNRLRNSYYIKHWKFFDCSKFLPAFNTITKKSRNLELSLSQKSTRIPLDNSNVFRATITTKAKRSILMSMMPTTDRISTFEGAYLKTPFNELLTNKVYRSYSNNGPVFDALTADPTAGRLFLYQSTLRNPYDKNVNIIEFNNVISNLSKDATSSSSSSSSTSDSIKEIYYFMIASAHQEFSSQHFYSFSIEELYLSSCYLSAYAAEGGINTLRKVISVHPFGEKSDSYRILEEEIKQFSEKELLLMKTIGGCYDRDEFYTYTLNQESYDHLFLFLKQYASKLRPYLCRAKFNNSTAYPSRTTKTPTINPSRDSRRNDVSEYEDDYYKE